MAVYRDEVCGKKVIRRKRFLWVFWLKDYIYSNTVEYNKWKMNCCIDDFNKYYAEMRKAEKLIESIKKDVGDRNGDFITKGPVYKAPGKLLCTTTERKAMWPETVTKQDDHWKTFARLCTADPVAAQTKHMTIAAKTPGKIEFDGEEVDVFEIPSRNNNNQNKQKQKQNQQNHQNH